jgi:hypothetical protein
MRRGVNGGALNSGWGVRDPLKRGRKRRRIRERY